jgi:(1->4)-alpha-D-glucan 1-alpha-D-glucosylmutase
MSARGANWPAAMSATSTHDTKRSEDVRARLAVLSEVPEQWGAAVRTWSSINAKHKRNGMPDPNAEYLLYQVLLGAHPLSRDRAHAYALKAAREAKVHTSWLDPNAAYEDALRDFIDGCFGDEEFCCALAGFVESIRDAGFVNSLTQKLIALTAPGVPDAYQGTELWDLSLVDPDNRRPVDYELRRRLLDRLDEVDAQTAWAERELGLPKLLVVTRALQLRRRMPEVFARGAYEPLIVSGERSDNVVAFARAGQVATIAPRLTLSVAGDWRDTTVELPAGEWHNEVTGERVATTTANVGDLLHRFPVALLVAS